MLGEHHHAVSRLRDVDGVELAEDATIAALAPARRRAIARHWLARAHGELSTAAVFTRVTQALLELGAEPPVLALAARGVGDEVRHARLCHALAQLYAGSALEFPTADGAEDVQFGDAPPRVNRVLLAVYHSCLNEGIATAYLQENLRRTCAPAARGVIRSLLRDDIEHARIGWAHLASARVTSDDRRHVAAALPTLLRIVSDAWLGPDVESDTDAPEHGCLPRSGRSVLVRAAIEDVILPGFEYVGIRTPALRW